MAPQFQHGQLHPKKLNHNTTYPHNLPPPQPHGAPRMPSQHPLSDLPDPAHQSLSQLLSQLRRTTLSVHNRLASIRDDAAFVSRVAAAFAGRPLVANERCGSWYVRSGDKAAGAYFKSTDGHESAWKFSCRRLNLHVVRMVEEHDG